MFGGGPTIPHESLADMEYDGVFGGTIFPTAGVGGIWRIGDTGLLNVVCSLYNEWIADFCKPYPDRLKGVAMLNLDVVEEGVRELYRARDLGLTAALITVYPKHERQYHNPEYEPLWAAAQELGMPLCLHSGSHRDGVPMDQFNDEDPQQSPWGHVLHAAVPDHAVHRFDDLVEGLRAVSGPQGRQCGEQRGDGPRTSST